MGFLMMNDFYKKNVKYNDKYLDSFVRYSDKPKFMNPRFFTIFFKIASTWQEKETKKSTKIFDMTIHKSFLSFFKKQKLACKFLALKTKAKSTKGKSKVSDYDCFKDSYRDMLDNTNIVPFEENKIAVCWENNDEIKSFNMCLCPKGFFIYQDTQGIYQSRGLNYGYGIKIEMTNDFWVSETKVTQEIWQDVMGSNLSYFNGRGKEDITIEYSIERTSNRIPSLTYTKPNEYGFDLQRPMDSISWYDAIEFCNRLSLLNGFTPCYKFEIKNDTNYPMVHWDVNANGFRLLTDVEWDYVSKAISSNSKIKAQSKYIDMYWNEKRYDDFCKQIWNPTWEQYDMIKQKVKNQMHSENPNLKTYKDNTSLLQQYVYNFYSVMGIPKVAMKEPNAFGLYDMHGYSAEWVFDSVNLKSFGGTQYKNKVYIILQKEFPKQRANPKYVMSNLEAYMGQDDTKSESYAKGFTLDFTKPSDYVQQANYIYHDHSYDKRKRDKFIGLRIAKNKD